MYTINFKGKPHFKDGKLVNIILFKVDYHGVSKALNISGWYEDWDRATKNFKPKSKEANSKNKILFDLRLKYQKSGKPKVSNGHRSNSLIISKRKIKIHR